MNKKICLVSAVAGLVGLVGAEGRAAEAVTEMEVPARESAWRISVGGVQRFGIKSDFAVDPSAAIVLLPAVDALKVESDFVKGEIRQGERQVAVGIGVRF